ncbi:MAG TPA: propionyl-CoA synthetase [Chitinophagaceae bacterium]|nr:propionyl-CoA synthetase [Chitinophagaceae bacterium]
MVYQSLYRKSIDEKEKFWKEQSERIPWFTEPQTILSVNEQGFYRWFTDGRCNMAYACLDWQIEQGRGSQVALIYDSPVANKKEKISYDELATRVARFAHGLQSLGIGKGDTVVVYMPMIPEAVISMLACARIGAIHSVVFGGFAPHELAMRIDDAKPVAIISASYGIEFDKKIPYKPLVDQALREAVHQPAHRIFVQREPGYDKLEKKGEYDFDNLQTFEESEAVPMLSTDPLYILYTSGTTGKPKGIVRDHGGYATALAFSMKHVYDAHAGDVFWAASDVGWVVGHSYIVYGPLLAGCTTVLYEGKPVRTPDAGAFWRVISEYGVNVFFTAPTAIRAIRKEDHEAALLAPYKLSSLRYLFLAGERCDPATFHWAREILQVPVIDHWWQTESGWPMLGIMMGVEPLPVKAGSAGLPVCGFDIRIISEDGAPLPPGREGLVTVRLPLPPGCLPTLWKNDERFIAGYLSQVEGHYLTGDGGYYDEDGYFFIMGRVDDVINVSGHRLSTGEMEELVATHPAVAESAVVGIADELRGQRPVALVVMKDGRQETEAQLEQELVSLIREKIGAVAFFRNVLLVKRLPKTRSGKILRKTIRQIADGDAYTIPSTIDDPVILQEITFRLKEREIGRIGEKNISGT